MKTIDQLKKELSEKRALNTTLADTLKKENRQMTDEELGEVENRKAEIEKLEVEMRKAIAYMNITQVSGPTPEDGEGKEMRKHLSLTKMVRHAAGIEKNGFVEEMHQEAVKEARGFGESIIGFGLPHAALRALETRANNVTTATEGGNTVPTNMIGFIENLKSKLVFPGLGANYLTGLTGNVEMPIGTNEVVATFKTEVASADELTPTVGKRTMTAKRLPAYGPISKQLITQASIDVEAWVQGMFERAIAVALNQVGINGSGTAPVPTGILTLAGTSELTLAGANGSALTWANVVALAGLVEAANADGTSMGYLTNSKVKAALATTSKDTGSGLFVWNDSMPNMPLYGQKAAVTNLVPSNLVKGASGNTLSAMIYGDFSQMYIGQFGGLDITVDTLSLARTGQIAITINSFWDIAYGHAAAFSKCVQIVA